MTTKQLTDSILQMAIQGKLVPQDPNDEPADVLLERIREEKKRMVKEKLLKKSALAETEIIADDIPFDIPESWVWTTISNIFIINPKVNGEDNDNAAFIPMEKIDAGYSSSFTYEERKWKDIKSSYTNFADGDVAFAKITPCFQNRKSVIFCNLPNGIGAGTTELKVLRQYGESIDRKYLLYFLKSPYFINEAKFKGTANQQRIVIGYLENKYFPLPPLAEQHRIVERIEEYLPIIKEYGDAYDEAAKMDAELPDKLKKSILQEAILGKLGTQDPSDEPASALIEKIRAEKQKLVEEGVLKKKDLEETPVEDDEVPFNIPKTWGCFHLGEITYNHGQKKPDSDFSYIDIGSIDNKNQKLNEKENILSSNEAPSRARKIVKRGDIIYATVRPYLHNMCIIDRDFSKEPIVSTGFAVLSCIKGVYNKYLFYYLLSPVFDEYANDGDNAKGMAYPAINDKKLYNGVVPLPPLAEQHRIVKKIEELYAEIDNMTVENNININEIEVTDNE